MDCRRFTEHHVAYVDSFLPHLEMEAMHAHLRACPRCARRDTAVRRGLMLARTLPSIRTSDDFMARLESRLQDVRSETPAHLPWAGAFAGAATCVALAVYALLSLRGQRPLEPLRLAPVVASVPEQQPSPIANAALLASVGVGMPVWPAVMAVGQAQMHLANLELQQPSAGDH
ncbi:MAG: hypothetical protein JWO05_1870 [Gemmatimonadetes bacterium]|nr:hypothetical protein [Gemmatimonadota bacterium]